MFKIGSQGRIASGKLLRSSDILHNIKKKAQNLVFLDQQVMNQTVTLDNVEDLNVNAEDPTKSIIFLPYTIRGLVRNHIVFFAINKNTQEIIFYDSKGFSIQDRDLTEIYKHIKFVFPGYKFVQNTKKEQCDSFNCGIYVLKRILELNDNPDKSFSSILEKRLSYGDVMKIRQGNLFEDAPTEVEVVDRSSEVTDF